MTGHDQRPVSLILRVLPGPAATGELIGQVETVDSGVVAFLRRGDDAVDALCRAAVARRGEDSSPRSVTEVQPDAWGNRRDH
jgi:hypothetical protein